MTESEPLPESEADRADGWLRVNPLSMAVQMLRTLGSALLPAALGLYGVTSSDADSEGLAMVLPWAIPILVMILGFTLFGSWLGWVRLRYRVGESDVRVEQGIISRQARSVPYDRIQDVSLEQKLIPRLLGLVEVKFETGAGGKEELKLSYVSEDEGEKLRETVRALVEGEAAQPAASADPQASEAAAEVHGETLFAMGTGRLFTFGLFNFSLVIFAVLLGALQQLEFLLPFDLWDYAEDVFRDDRIAEAGDLVSSYSTAAQILAIAYALIAVVVVGMASGVVRTFVRDWEFRLERTPKGFRRRRGLLTRTDVVMPVHRVQALVVKTGAIRRRFGWHGLSFISLAQDSGSANHDVAPFAKMAEIAPIATEAGFSLPDGSEEWRRPSPRYYTDRAVLLATVWIIPAMVLILLGHSLIGLVLAGLAVLSVVREAYLWRYDRHALDPLQVLSRKGWLAPRTQIANRVKLHSVEIAQGPLGRWRGYCNLNFGMAGGRFSFAGLAVEDAGKLRAAVLDSIAAVDFAKLPR